MNFNYPCTGPQTVCVWMYFPSSLIRIWLAHPDDVQAATRMIMMIRSIRPKMMPQTPHCFCRSSCSNSLTHSSFMSIRHWVFGLFRPSGSLSPFSGSFFSVPDPVLAASGSFFSISVFDLSSSSPSLMASFLLLSLSSPSLSRSSLVSCASTSWSYKKLYNFQFLCPISYYVNHQILKVEILY